MKRLGFCQFALPHNDWVPPHFTKFSANLKVTFRLVADQDPELRRRLAALIRTLDDAASSGDDFSAESMVTQVDQLIISAIQALDGPAEAEMVSHLLRLRDSLRDRQAAAERAADLSGVQKAALDAVNAYFERALRALPEIDAYLREIAAREH